MKQNKHLLWIVIPFFAFLLLFSAASVILPDYTYSPEEGRGLTQRPPISLSAVSRWEDYTVDQFPLRSHLLKAYSALELAQGKKLTRNTYIADDQWLMTPIYEVEEGRLQRLLDAVAAAEAETDAAYFYAVIPQKNDMLAELEPEYFSNTVSDSNKVRLLDGLQRIDSLQVLDVGGYMLAQFTPEQRSQMYYKGDFHWNHLGAYEAAAYLCDAMGRPAPETDFVWQTLSASYNGDLNRRFSYLFSRQEELPFYTYACADTLQYYDSPNAAAPVARNTIVGKGLENTSVDYNSLSTDNLGYYRVVNPNRDGCLIILKDSFQNPTIDCFSAVYGEIHVIDPRFYDETVDFYELSDRVNPDDVLFFFHQNNASSELIDFLTK